MKLKLIHQQGYDRFYQFSKKAFPESENVPLLKWFVKGKRVYVGNSVFVNTPTTHVIKGLIKLL